MITWINFESYDLLVASKASGNFLIIRISSGWTFQCVNILCKLVFHIHFHWKIATRNKKNNKTITENNYSFKCQENKRYVISIIKKLYKSVHRNRLHQNFSIQVLLVQMISHQHNHQSLRSFCLVNIAHCIVVTPISVAYICIVLFLLFLNILKRNYLHGIRVVERRIDVWFNYICN